MVSKIDKKVKKCVFPILLFLLLISNWVYSAQGPNVTEVIFFKNTQFPLKAFFIKGEKPGPTIMVQGGIQGDEICGVLTAESLLMARVVKGNLIVIPRANIPSLLKRKRGINVDLNRRFDKRYCQFYEDHLADAIKFLVSLCDGLIHLHEGSGFYSPVFISEMRNPKRYGQSFIIDTYTYKNKLPLGNTLRPILEALNSQIPNKKYWFKIFNTDTTSPYTLYPEQRKSLTYYTLTKKEIPAIAIEVSKDIKNIRWKWKIQLTATKMVLKRLGVYIDLSPVKEKEILHPRERGLNISIGGVKIMERKNIVLSPLMDINYRLKSHDMAEIGLFASSLPNLNLLTLRAMPILSSTSHIELRIDGEIAKQWNVRYNPDIFHGKENIFICQLNNRILCVPAGSTIMAHEGDRLVLLGIMGGTGKEVLNLKGYLSQSGYNNGQDMGADILLEKDFFMPRYITSLKGGIWKCEVVREDLPGTSPSFEIKVAPKNIYGIKLAGRGSVRIYPLSPNKTIVVKKGTYRIAIYPQGNYQENVLLFYNRKPIENNIIHINSKKKKRLIAIDENTARKLATIYITGY